MMIFGVCSVGLVDFGVNLVYIDIFEFFCPRG